MTIEELRQGYVNEVNYQKKMLSNLQKWFTLFFMISATGIVLIYYFHTNILWLFVCGIILLILGIVGMSVFGYGQWKGRQNLNLLIDDFERKVTDYSQTKK